MAARSPIHIEVDHKDILRVIVWLNRLDEVLDSSEKWTSAIQTLGVMIQDLFDSEGAAGGKRWQRLSAFTQQVRQERDFDPQHPILQQTGKLKEITAGTLSYWRHGASGYIKTFPGVSLAANATAREFKATISGPKVANNQMGLSSDVATRERQFLPARPFFYLPGDSPRLMTNLVAAQIMTEWQYKGAGVRRAYGRMSRIPTRGSRRSSITLSM